MFTLWPSIVIMVIVNYCAAIHLQPVDRQGVDPIDYFWKIERYIKQYCNNGVRKNLTIELPVLINIESYPNTTLSPQQRAAIAYINEDFNQQCRSNVTNNDTLSSERINLLHYFWKIERYIKQYCNNGVRKNLTIELPVLIDIESYPNTTLAPQQRAAIARINEDFNQQCGLNETESETLATVHAEKSLPLN